MINFLHTFNPHPVLIAFGPLKIYWYGMFIVLGILAAFYLAFYLAEYYNIRKEIIVDSVFWSIIFGVIGARLYHVFLDFSYYSKNPLNIFKLWQGGLAIHGAIIAGLIVLWSFCKKNRINFWLLTAIYVPGLSLAQAIGRFGNYFNQELYGRPTGLPWGIPINPAYRLNEYAAFTYFHPTFIYESLLSFLIFAFLLYLHFLKIKKKKNIPAELIVGSYLILYSLARILTETIRIDPTPIIFGLRFPQFAGLIIIIAVFIFWLKKDIIKQLFAKIKKPW